MSGTESLSQFQKLIHTWSTLRWEKNKKTTSEIKKTTQNSARLFVVTTKTTFCHQPNLFVLLCAEFTSDFYAIITIMIIEKPLKLFEM